MNFDQYIQLKEAAPPGMGAMGGAPGGMAGGMGAPPGGMGGGMGGMGMPPMGGGMGGKPPMGGPLGGMMGGGPQQQNNPMEIKTKDVWSLLEKVLSGKKIDDKNDKEQNNVPRSNSLNT